MSGEEHTATPTDLHLAKLALHFTTWEDLRSPVISMGLKVSEININEVDYGGNLLNVMFLCLRMWRNKTSGTVGDLINAI